MKYQFIILFEISLLIIFISSCGEKETTLINPFNIRYGDSNHQLLDIYTKDVNAKSNVVIFVHGGAWCFGDKEQIYPSFIQFFNRHNCVLVSINYRLSEYPLDLTNKNRIMHPSHLSDVKKSILWVKENIARFGGNSNEIYIIGHSAGAQLALLSSLNNPYIKRVILLDAGPYLTINNEYLFGDKADIYINNIPIGDYFINAFGKEDTYNFINPLILIDDTFYCPPILQIYQSDTKSRSIPNQDLHNKFLKYNIVTKLEPIPKYSHNDFVHIIGTDKDSLNISSSIIDFINKTIF